MRISDWSSDVCSSDLNIDLERVVLRDADVLIETDSQGRSNLDFDAPGDESEGGDEVADGEDDFDLDIGEARIENISVTLIDGRAGTTTVARLDRAIMAPPQPDAPLDVDVKGNIKRGENVARSEEHTSGL